MSGKPGDVVHDANEFLKNPVVFRVVPLDVPFRSASAPARVHFVHARDVPFGEGSPPFDAP